MSGAIVSFQRSLAVVGINAYDGVPRVGRQR
jgi:hypothetical protein